MQGTQRSLFEIVSRRWRTFAIASSSISLLVALGYLAQPQRYEVSGIFQPKTTEPRRINADNSSSLLEQLRFLDDFLDQFFRSDSEITPEAKLIKDDEALQNTIQSLKIEDHEGNPASPRSLRRRIRLSNQSTDDSVSISIFDQDPAQGERIINHLMKFYVNRFASESPTESVNFTSVLQPHLVNASTLGKQAQQALYQVQLGTNQTPLAPSVKAGDQTLELQSIRISSEQQLSTINSELEILQQELNIAPPERKTLLQSVIELSSIRKQVLEQLYEVLELPRDDSKLGSLLTSLESKTLDLKKNLILTQDIYTTFLERQQTPWTFNQDRRNTVQVIRPAAIATKGLRPYLKWFVGLGVLAGMGAGSYACLFKESKNDSLRSLSDLYAYLKLPIFGIVPNFSSKALSIQSLARQDGTEFQEFAQITAAYDQITGQLAVSSLNRIPQVLAFTSTVSNEGKSLTVANLAYCLAKKGKKILLLEADLFHPSQFQFWNKTQAIGLCDCIAGKIQVGKALQRLHPNLDLLQAGNTPNNKDILLNSPGIKLFIKEFRSRYDHILVDTPALSHSLHGYLISNCADATLLVTRPGKITKANVFTLKETIDRTHQKLWGMIINSSPHKTGIKRIQKLIQDSQWDATIRLQHGSGNTFELSTLSAINQDSTEHSSDLLENGNRAHLDAYSNSKYEKQEPYLYQLPLEELHKLVDALWESWSHDVEILLEQEEEVVQQSRLVRELEETIERGNPYLKLSSELQLKEEKEKFNLLADTYIGQRPNLINDREELQFYLEVLFARTEAEFIPIS